MAGSKAFALIKQDVEKMVLSVPFGRITTFNSIGAWMTVQPRHVAWILKRLQPQEQDLIPWHRVVREQGQFSNTLTNYRGQTQTELLALEGIISRDHRVIEFDSLFLNAAKLSADVRPGKSYSDLASN